ncbi:PepSY domain-containing protein [Streptococcus tangpeifui]|uniref:PepSY domain-containing protein n=1 Tax=Streptococcus tangpeifui TaxID=2709400 RepID=UPI0013EDBB9E|nr:PepSY domain-containing protein [Streptococcus sp. ZJ373]
MTKLFRTKKLPYAALTTIGLTIASFSGLSAVSANSHSSADCISQEQAKTVALKDCGVKEKQAHFTRVQKTSYQNKVVYVIDFQKGQEEYNYTVDAHKGTVTQKDNKSQASQASTDTTPTDSAPSTSAPTNGTGESSQAGSSSSSSSQAGSNSSSQSSGGQNQAMVTNEEAKQIALNNAGLTETQVNELKVDKDQQDDSPVYKINFKYGECDYSYVVSAANGSILEIDNDTENSSEQSNSTSQSTQTDHSSQASQGSQDSNNSASSRIDDQDGDYDSDNDQNHHDGDDDGDDDEDLNDEYE